MVEYVGAREGAQAAMSGNISMGAIIRYSTRSVPRTHAAPSGRPRTRAASHLEGHMSSQRGRGFCGNCAGGGSRWNACMKAIRSARQSGSGLDADKNIEKGKSIEKGEKRKKDKAKYDSDVNLER